jgi:hypothetical protein
VFQRRWPLQSSSKCWRYCWRPLQKTRSFITARGRAVVVQAVRRCTTDYPASCCATVNAAMRLPTQQSRARRVSAQQLRGWNARAGRTRRGDDRSDALAERQSTLRRIRRHPGPPAAMPNGAQRRGVAACAPNWCALCATEPCVRARRAAHLVLVFPLESATSPRAPLLALAARRVASPRRADGNPGWH